VQTVLWSLLGDKMQIHVFRTDAVGALHACYARGSSSSIVRKVRRPSDGSDCSRLRADRAGYHYCGDRRAIAWQDAQAREVLHEPERFRTHKCGERLRIHFARALQTRKAQFAVFK